MTVKRAAILGLEGEAVTIYIGSIQQGLSEGAVVPAASFTLRLQTAPSCQEAPQLKTQAVHNLNTLQACSSIFCIVCNFKDVVKYP